VIYSKILLETTVTGLVELMAKLSYVSTNKLSRINMTYIPSRRWERKSRQLLPVVKWDGSSLAIPRVWKCGPLDRLFLGGRTADSTYNWTGDVDGAL